MAGSTSAVALGLAVSALIAFLPVAMVWAVLNVEKIGEHAVALGRRCHLLRPEQPVTYDPPIERITADLRRLSAEMGQERRGTSAVLRRGLQMAYDDKLMAACRALDLPYCLDQLGEGMDRELERIRMETALEGAGLRFRSKPSW